MYVCITFIFLRFVVVTKNNSLNVR